MRAWDAMSVVSWDKFLATSWAPLSCWSFSHGVKQEVHSLSQNSSDVRMVIEFLSQFKNELKMLI